MHVGLVLVKCGSLGLPGKNLLKYKGRTLLQITLEEMAESNCFKALYVSTNCQEIAYVAGKIHGVQVIRRPEYFGDNLRYVDSINHAVVRMKPNPKTITVAQVVQPIREPGIFTRMLKLHGSDVDAVVTVEKFDSSLDWIFHKNNKTDKLEKVDRIRYEGDIARKNDLWLIDNAIISFTYESWKKSDGLTAWPYLGKRIIGVEQRHGNSHYSADINTAQDFEWYQFISTFPQWKLERQDES